MINWTKFLWALSPCWVGCSQGKLFSTDDEAQGDEAYTLTIEGTESCPLPKSLNPKKVKILSYRVRLIGRLSSGVPANYFYASLLTADGSRYLASHSGCAPLLSGKPLAPSESMEGFLNFPLPPSKTPRTLVYSPLLLGREKDADLVSLAVGSEETHANSPDAKREN